MDYTPVSEKTTTRLAPPTWPHVAYDGAVWRATYIGKIDREHALTLRTGKRQPATVPARLCQWSRP